MYHVKQYMLPMQFLYTIANEVTPILQNETATFIFKYLYIQFKYLYIQLHHRSVYYIYSMLHGVYKNISKTNKKWGGRLHTPIFAF